MRILLGGSIEKAKASIREALNSCAPGCVLVESCSLHELPEGVNRHRPDVAIVDFSGDVELALRSIDEMREVDNLGVLAVGPSSDAKLILRALNQGVDKYVDAEALEVELPAALRHIRTTPRRAPLRGRVIAVLGASGGTGATTLVANLGMALSKKKKCTLVDLDLEGGDLAAMLGVQPTNSVAEFCEHLDRVDETLLDKCLLSCSTDLSLLPAPSDYRKIARVTPRGVRKAIHMVRTLGPYVVVDVPSTFRPEQAQALVAADIIVVVLRAEFTSVRQTSRVLTYLAELSIPPERIKLVVNRRQWRQGLRDADMENALQRRIHMSIPEHHKHMSVAVNRGIPLVIDRPRSPVSHRLMELAHSVNGVVELATPAPPKV